jgi:hypothetical protein
MPSTKFRVQLYLDPDIEQHLRNWIAERQFTSDSAALNQLLREYFNLEKAEGIEAFDWKVAIAAEVSQQLEPIKSWLAQLDDNYGTLLKQVVESPLLERIKLIEAQMRMEVESPQPGAYQEALETATYQQYVIEELQQELKELKRESPSNSPPEALDKQAEETEDQEESVESLGDLPSDLPEFYEQVDEEIEQLLSDAPTPEPNLEECVERAIAILEAQFNHLNKVELKKFSEELLMEIIYITSPSLSVEQAEEILKRVLDRIPDNPPLAAILGSEEAEAEAELNLNEDSPSDSPRESPEKAVVEELNHKQLSQRLGIKTNTLRGARNRPDFKTWSQQHDPYGLAWGYDSQEKIYRGFKVEEI